MTRCAIAAAALAAALVTGCSDGGAAGSSKNGPAFRFAPIVRTDIVRTVEATGKVLCFIEVAELPPDAPRSVYRDLLAGGLFGKETAGGYFALEPETETVVYNYIFDLDEAAKDVEEFISTLEKTLQLCDIWAERIKNALSDSGSGFNIDDHHPAVFHISP